MRTAQSFKITSFSCPDHVYLVSFAELSARSSISFSGNPTGKYRTHLSCLYDALFAPVRILIFFFCLLVNGQFSRWVRNALCCQRRTSTCLQSNMNLKSSKVSYMILWCTFILNLHLYEGMYLSWYELWSSAEYLAVIYQLDYELEFDMIKQDCHLQ